LPYSGSRHGSFAGHGEISVATAARGSARGQCLTGAVTIANALQGLPLARRQSISKILFKSESFKFDEK
jgi:hypothetical protein